VLGLRLNSAVVETNLKEYDRNIKRSFFSAVGCFSLILKENVSLCTPPAKLYFLSGKFL
jgi:hypothetical protein